MDNVSRYLATVLPSFVQEPTDVALRTVGGEIEGQDEINIALSCTTSI